LEEEFTREGLDYLRERLEIRSQSICKKYFPIEFGRNASISKTEITIPRPEEVTNDVILDSYCHQIHESSHVEFSSLDFERAKKTIRDNKLNMKEAHHLLNIIDDYRVNTLQLYSHPGAGKLMESRHMKMVKDLETEDAIVALLPGLLGYPIKANLSSEEQEKLDKAIPLIKPVINHLDLTGCLEVLPKAYDIFFEREEEREGESPYGKAHRESEEEAKFKEDRGLFGSRGTKQNVKKALKKMKQAEKGKAVETKKEEKEAESEMKKIEKEIEKVTTEIKKINAIAKDDEKTLAYGLKELEEEFKAGGGLPVSHKMIRHSNRADYKRVVSKYKNEINILVREMKKIITFNKRWETGKKSGRLDTRKAYKIVSNGNTNVFKKKHQKEVGNMAVLILVDCSGSMRINNRMVYAKQSSIILHEVFRKLKINHMIVGYTGDLGRSGVDHLIYKTWDDKRVAFPITEMRHISQNRDGDSIRLGIKYFKKRPEKQKLTIMISDGHPEANNYRGDKALADTVEAQKEMKKKGIKLVNVGIGQYYRLPDEYINKIKVDEVAKLPTRLMKVVKKEIK